MSRLDYPFPIIKDVRHNAEKLVKEVEYDADRYIERLRINQWKSGRNVVNLSKRKELTQS
jgi:hypothetical protein